MKKISKVLALLLALTMVLSMAACGGSGSGSAAASSAKPAAAASSAKSEAPAAAASSAKSEAPAAAASSAKSEAPAAPADPSDPKAVAEAAGYDYTKVDTSDWINLDLSYAAFLPEGNPISDTLYYALAESCENLMPGYVNIELFAGGTLVGQQDMLEGIMTGVADVGMIDLGPVTSMLPVTAFWASGCLEASSCSALTAAMMEWLQNNYDLPEFENIVPLSCQGIIANQLCTTKQWSKLDDIKGMQCCVPGTYSEMLKAMGTVPVSMDTSELYEASRSGLVEGAFYTIGMNFLCGSQEFLKYVTVTGYGSSPYLVAMNKDVFNSMPPLQQEFMLEAGRQATWEIVLPKIVIIGDMFEPSIQCINDTDYTYFDLPQETRDAIGEVVAPLRQQYIDSVKGTNPEIEEQSQEILRLNEKWLDWFPLERFLAPVYAANEGKFAEWMVNVEENTKLPELLDIEGYVPLAKR